MISSRKDYFRTIGFKQDPFASTNALQEEFLEEYFVVPPYFYSLVGSTNAPKSSFIIAPRGTGKTAQRVMLEKMAEKQEEMLAVVYDEFPIENGIDLKKLTLEDHLKRIIRSLIIALLSELNDSSLNNILDQYQRTNLKKLIHLYLYGINSGEINKTIKKIKGLAGRIEDIWCRAGESVTSIINAIITKKGLGKIDLSVKPQKERQDIGSHFTFIEELFRSVGIFSVYVLVDSIDETVATGNNAEKSYQLIRPFILDLRLLERKTIVFKFFVWDKIEEYWSEEFRKDRIENYKIKWNKEEIKQLLSKRLEAYSEGKYTRLDELLDCDEELIEYIYIFANGSPRDAINILKSIFDEYLRGSKEGMKRPDTQVVISGLESFCRDKFEEIVTNEKQRRNLKRIKLTTFTIPYLYNDIYKCESSTARNILMPWTRAGIVNSSANKIKVNKNQNPINVYTFSDIRIARYVCSNQKFDKFVQRNMLICEECGTTNIFDKENMYGIKHWQCQNCMSELLEIEERSEKGQDGKGKKKIKKGGIEGQISLFDIKTGL